MMDISKMTDQEKSVLLAKAMGWFTPMRKDMDDPKPLIIPPEGDGILWADSLYDPANMALAWRVLNWAWNDLVINFWFQHYDLGNMPPEEAQREWLDKILELAIEAVIVEVNDGRS